MTVTVHHLLHPPHCSSPLPAFLSSTRSLRSRISCSSSSLVAQMDPYNNEGRTKFKAFPYVSTSHRNLMVDLVSTVENRLDSSSFLVLYRRMHNTTRTRVGPALLRSTSDLATSPPSWIHCELPTGGALNITSLSAYLNPSTDAPNFLFELIQSSPTSLILILDLPPRKDLVLSPDYLRTFYEDTQLDRHRQTLEKIPEVRPYVSSSLYIRSLVSPTAITVRIETEANRQGRMEEVIKDHIHPIAKEVLGIWLDQCACGEREVGETERGYLEKRDGLVKSRTIEIDLGSSLPRLFGPEVAERVLGSVTSFYCLKS